jgi:hypothetical protein
MLAPVSHPSLGKPPISLLAGFPDGAARLRANAAPLAARSLEIAIDADPTIRSRYDEPALRNLLRDAEVFVERLALCVAADDPSFLEQFADQTATIFRRRKVGMDDVTKLLEGLRSAARGILAPAELGAADRGIDAAVAVYLWYRQIAGDARKKNPILQAIYKGIGS